MDDFEIKKNCPLYENLDLTSDDLLQQLIKLQSNLNNKNNTYFSFRFSISYTDVVLFENIFNDYTNNILNPFIFKM